MPWFNGRFRVESIRLPWWDYAAEGWYFITLCTKGRKCFFGEVVDDGVRLSGIGEIVAEEWEKTEEIRSGITLDEFVIMPNHLHGIIVIGSVNGKETPERETSYRETPHRGVSTEELPCDRSGALKANSLGAMIGQFKSVCTKRIRAAGFSDFAWQPRFYEHIIRNEQSLSEIREYIANNPAKWELDKDNPKNLL